MKRALHTSLAVVLSVATVGLGSPQVAAGAVFDAPPSDEQVAPSEDSDSALPDIEDPGSAAPLDLPAPDGVTPAASEPAVVDSPSSSESTEPAPSVEPPPPTMQQPNVVRVAVGLSTELDGSLAERELLDTLEAGIQASRDPSSDVRRLRVGAAEPRELCREGRDDLVINVGYMPDRSEPVLLTYDCRIDESLGIRAREAAGDPELLGVLWAEHNQRISEGARERRRARISPKVRTGLIAGAAVVVIGAAISLLIVGAVQRDTVVLVVSPNSP